MSRYLQEDISRYRDTIPAPKDQEEAYAKLCVENALDDIQRIAWPHIARRINAERYAEILANTLQRIQDVAAPFAGNLPQDTAAADTACALIYNECEQARHLYVEYHPANRDAEEQTRGQD